MVELPGEAAGKIPDAGSDSSAPVSKQPRKWGGGAGRSLWAAVLWQKRQWYISIKVQCDSCCPVKSSIKSTLLMSGFGILVSVWGYSKMLNFHCMGVTTFAWHKYLNCRVQLQQPFLCVL